MRRIISVVAAFAVVASLPLRGLAATQEQAAERGAALYQAKCGACHSPEENRVGPRHRGVLGRHAGTIADYDYSSALRASKIVWSTDTLERWLRDPEQLVPGQKMAYRVNEPKDRQDLIAYLATLH